MIRFYYFFLCYNLLPFPISSRLIYFPSCYFVDSCYLGSIGSIYKKVLDKKTHIARQSVSSSFLPIQFHFVSQVYNNRSTAVKLLFVIILIDEEVLLPSTERPDPGHTDCLHFTPLYLRFNDNLQSASFHSKCRKADY